MIILTSPSKTLDLDGEYPSGINYTQNRFLDSAQLIMKYLKQQSVQQIKNKLSISHNLANLNYQRFQQWEEKHNLSNSRPAIFTYKGDVFQQLKVNQYTEAQLQYSQKVLRIISGLYGLVRPLDLIQAYRLEMRTKLSFYKQDKKLPMNSFWNQTLTKILNNQIDKYHHQSVVNLASNEYTKALDFKSLNCPVINFHFKDKRDGQYKTIAIYAKQARGSVIDFAIRNQIQVPEKLKNWTGLSYRFNSKQSRKQNWVFTH